MRTQMKIFLVGLVLLSACHKESIPMWETLCVKENNHGYKPYKFTWEERTTLSYKFQFPPNDSYDLGDADQCDWNKLTGLSFHIETSTKDAVMVGFRWDTDGFWWVVPYYHIDKETFYGPAPCTGYGGDPVSENLKALKALPAEDITVTFTIFEPLRQTVSILIETSEGSSYTEVDYPFPIGKVREIYPWFGGNRSAPNELCLFRFPLIRI